MRYVAYMGIGKMHSGYLVRKDEGRRPLARPRHKMGGYRVWIGLVWLRAGSRRGCYEKNNKRFRGFHKVQAIS